MRISDILILGIIIGSFLFYFINKKINVWRSRQKYLTAKKAEKDAISFLLKQGYDIIDVQQKQPLEIFIDGKSYQTHVQVDFIVKKNGKRYVVEVKTGQKTRATTALVRRQLLEYYLVFNPDGILLLDMDKGTLKRIEFSWGRPQFAFKRLIMLCIIGLVIGALIWFLWG
ncbi:MAG: hypothetical protein ACOYVD_04810 [Bacillota bacterium]